MQVAQVRRRLGRPPAGVDEVDAEVEPPCVALAAPDPELGQPYPHLALPGTEAGVLRGVPVGPRSGLGLPLG
jgi:hypothetical protein